MNASIQMFLWYLVAVQIVATFMGIVDGDEYGFVVPYIGTNMLLLGAYLFVFSLSKFFDLMIG